MDRLLRTAQIPAQPGDADRAPAPHATEHDHAWRRVPAQREAEFNEYRCDLCELSYSE
jgi:hypothetical protein